MRSRRLASAEIVAGDGADGRYAPACIKLLAQYKSLMKLVGDDVGGVETFMKRYRVSNHETSGTRQV